MTTEGSVTVGTETTVTPSFTLIEITGLDGPGILSHPRLFLITSVVYLLTLKKKVKAKRHLYSTNVKKNETDLCIERTISKLY